MTECPVFTTFTDGTQFLTADNIRELQPDVFSRTVGTVVTVTCNGGFTLTGDSTFECLDNGQWSYPTKPTCDSPPTITTTTAPSDDLDNDTKILIGVVCAVAALIVLILIIMFIVVRLRDKRRKRRNEDMRRTMIMGDRPDGPDWRRRRGGRDHDDLSTIDGELYRDAHMPPPYRPNPPSYRNEDSRRHARSNLGSQRSGPMYLPSSRSGRDYSYSDKYDKISRSRKRPESIDEEYERRGKKPYVSDWIRNSVSESEDYSYSVDNIVENMG